MKLNKNQKNGNSLTLKCQGKLPAVGADAEEQLALSGQISRL